MERNEYLLEVELTNAFEKLKNLSSREKEKAIILIKNLINENEVPNCFKTQGCEKPNSSIEPCENSGNIFSETNFTADTSESKRDPRKDVGVLMVETFETRHNNCEILKESLVSPNLEVQSRSVVDSTITIGGEDQGVKVKSDIRTYCKRKQVNKINNYNDRGCLKGPVESAFKGDFEKKKWYYSSDKWLARTQDVTTCSGLDVDNESIEYQHELSTIKRCNQYTQNCSEPYLSNSAEKLIPHIDLPSTSGDRYNCSFQGCGRLAGYQSRMDLDMAKQTRERKFKGERCSKEYSQKSTVTEHQKSNCQPSSVQPSSNIISHEIEANKDGNHLQRGYRRRSENDCSVSSAESDEFSDSNRRYKQKKKIDLINKSGPDLSSNAKRSPSKKVSIDALTSSGERFVCSVKGCGYSASYKSRMNVHMVKHTGEKKFKCEWCSKEYSQKSTLTQHQKACCSQPTSVQSSTILTSYQDEFRKDSAIDKSSFENRSNTSSVESDDIFDRGRLYKKNRQMDLTNKCVQYPIESQNRCLEELNITRDERREGLGGEQLTEGCRKQRGGSLLCEACGATFRNGTHLKKHTRNEHSGSVSCAKCSFFGTLREVRIHERECHGKKVVECPVCNKTIVASFFQSHMTQHVNQTPFLCSLCGKSFKVHRYLQSHLRLRHQKRQFDCKVCGKEFETFAKLQRHEIVHTASKPFGCPFCSYRANVKNNVCKHARMVHGMTNFRGEQVLVDRWSLTNIGQGAIPVEVYDDRDAEFLVVANERIKTTTKISPPIEDVLKKLERKTGLSVTIEELILIERKKQAKRKLKIS